MNASEARRTRLEPERRRQQLLSVGAQLFSEMPFDEVSIEEIAVRAGVSRGLLYRYFPSKRDLFREIVHTAVAHLLAMTDPDPRRPLAPQLVAGIDLYLQQFEEHSVLVKAAYTAAASADQEVSAIIAAKGREHENRIVAALAAVGINVTDRLRVAVRAWVLMTRMIALDWLDTREISRSELRDLCAQSLLNLVSHAIEPQGLRAIGPTL